MQYLPLVNRLLERTGAEGCLHDVTGFLKTYRISIVI